MSYEVFEDRETLGIWRVEGLDLSTGEVEITLFVGRNADSRARHYYFQLTGEK